MIKQCVDHFFLSLHHAFYRCMSCRQADYHFGFDSISLAETINGSLSDPCLQPQKNHYQLEENNYQLEEIFF